MKQRDPSYPAAPTVPPQLKTGDYVRLDGPNAGVCTGLYKLMFYKNGTSFATLPIQRAFKDSFNFEVHGSFEGEIEVKGHYHDCATGLEHQHSFGSTHVSRD
ncbi:hypothetical protein SAMN04490186_0369 [Pseudomonas grimontii]|uniref:Uncharacterized protein n=1 Tax=Pseudomonas grimontii TaxID=129847 RepID=A0A1H1ALM2_9PSED|nr:hypothetical protein [Pseudomonas grimontii]TWR65420.1 hypothetical protein FIV39_16125 [Pseudomonas grimontii]SDQ40579.1 hypothetical protein SAMN04490186_0369 [Pseudomonas grimontii]